MKLEAQDYVFGKSVARYLFDRDTGAVSLVLLPKGKEDRFHLRREKLGVPELQRIGMDPDAWQVGRLVHLHLRHLSQSKGAGGTLKYGAASQALRLERQAREGDSVITWLRGDGWRVSHSLTWLGECWQVDTVFYNDSAVP